MRILLLASGFNVLTQRVWDELRTRDHHVAVTIYDDPAGVIAAADAVQPDLVLCSYLKQRVPAEVWARWRTVIIHPGPIGDQGPSSLDHAILDDEPVWGTTALQAVEELDGGPIWASRTFAMPTEPPRKSALYSGPVTAAAVSCALEVVELAADPSFEPTPLAAAHRPVAGTRHRGLLRQAQRRFDWADDAIDIVRRIRAADGFPGIRTVLADQEVSVFDARSGIGVGAPGEIIGRHHGHLLVAAGRGAVWIGQLKQVGGRKLPATSVLPVDVPDVPDGPSDVCYRRSGPVGEVAFTFYNGAVGIEHCRRLEAAIRFAASRDTRVLVLRSGPDVFCNGIHLSEIDAAPDPAAAAWRNVLAINSCCKALIEVEDQITIAAVAGSAAAGGFMLALGADVVVGRAGVMLNPYYDIGLFGSELHTLTLPHRVGRVGAEILLSAKLPISTDRAADIGLIDMVGPADPADFDEWMPGVASRYTDPAAWRGILRSRVPAARALDYCETRELAEMARDFYDDRSGFAACRRAFIERRPRASGLLIAGDRTDYDDFMDGNSLRRLWGSSLPTTSSVGH